MILQYRPLGFWNGPEPDVAPSPFSAPWTATLELLERETRLLQPGTRDSVVVVELDVAADDFRQDHRLRTSYRINSARVVVSFDSVHGPMRLQAGRYPMRLQAGRYRLLRDGRESWQANVRAVAKGLEALRAFARYGIGRSNEQYQGFGQLGTGMGSISAPGRMLESDAAAFLARHGGGVTMFDLYPPKRSAVMSAHRHAVQALHPDHGGEPGMLQKATEARDVLLDVAND